MEIFEVLIIFLTKSGTGGICTPRVLTAPYTQRCTVSKVDFCAPPPNKSARKMTSFRNYPRNHISYGMEPGLNNVNIPFFLGDIWENSKKVM